MQRPDDNCKEKEKLDQVKEIPAVKDSWLVAVHRD